ncbi:hypothetical protein BDN70DRAFT_932733 [Pholiota conissans]|uniref:F-box domain-containing protein n=1 Tax=Pholiota conissans TaxID=109636 RepID=A0A9P5Z1Z7_9AGAR|nr:hypothetical protein BDN70DRAFT_932733 [Pholiota conissans]
MPEFAQPIIPSQSSINKIPYDIVQEIFVSCVRQYHNQEDMDPIPVPIILSHICSFWRFVALTSPRLWLQLSYILDVDFTPTKITSTSESTATSAYRQSQIEYLQWWDKNRGSIPPFLRISIWRIHHNSSRYQNSKSIWVDGDSEAVKSVLKYITSAQYLDAKRGFWEEIRRRIKRGDQILFPNLRTISQRNPGSHFVPDQKRIGSVADANNVLPSLRHLSLYFAGRYTAVFPFNFSFPSHWSTLTHIYFFDIEITPNFWPSFIRCVPNLEWAYIYSDGLGNLDEEGINREPFKYTHVHLATLWLALHHRELSPSLLFAHLHLPALKELTLDFHSNLWRNPNTGLTELYSILQSTPNITTLGLTDTFLNLRDTEYHPPELQSIHPIWNYAPHIVHLHWEVFIFYSRGPERSMEELFDLFINHITIDAKWLQLDNPGCPIRQVTFVDAESKLTSSPEFESCKVFQVFKDMPFINMQIASRPAIRYIYNISGQWGQNLQ